MQRQITAQADTILYYKGEVNKLEADNQMLSERLAVLEETLCASGIMMPDGSFRDNAKTILRTASIVLAKLEELE